MCSKMEAWKVLRTLVLDGEGFDACTEDAPPFVTQGVLGLGFIARVLRSQLMLSHGMMEQSGPGRRLKPSAARTGRLFRARQVGALGP